MDQLYINVKKYLKFNLSQFLSVSYNKKPDTEHAMNSEWPQYVPTVRIGESPVVRNVENQTNLLIWVLEIECLGLDW